MKSWTAPFFTAILGVGLWGCTTTGGGTTTIAEAGVTPALAAPPVPCPPNGRVLERDLTTPWARRTYILPDGSTCRPGGGA